MKNGRRYYINKFFVYVYITYVHEMLLWLTRCDMVDVP